MLYGRTTMVRTSTFVRRRTLSLEKERTTIWTEPSSIGSTENSGVAEFATRNESLQPEVLAAHWAGTDSGLVLRPKPLAAVALNARQRGCPAPPERALMEGRGMASADHWQWHWLAQE